MLIRHVLSEDLAVLDERAKRAGLTRTDYLRRLLHTEARRGAAKVTPEDVDALASLISDLADPAVMRAAWS